MDQSLFMPKPSARTVLIANERTKLTAGYVNAIAGSIFTVGGLAPIFAILYTSNTPSVPIPVMVGIAVVCWITSGTLHYAAWGLLRELA
ncbi:amino acid transporter protein [Methylobacterium sp. J-072]|uniref:amino acid transporter protein n=1 Tax=Methylobacterium sp. J-072 TaxID=2836651 RepID=UPI001FB926DA|nr:amino acid transporter protein [Methylobacterium sp. J-072]MCJ2096827.1 amino acid transporter protein [Methylobacterium sp. J-072]